jgi:hypothetical protein
MHSQVMKGTPQQRLEKYMKLGKSIRKVQSQACNIHKVYVTKVVEIFVKHCMTKRY